jgi:O-methyltransferase
VRRGPGTLYRRLQSVRFLLGRDRDAVLAFLAARYPIRLSRARRLDLVRRFVTITNHVRSYHQQAELLTVADRVLRRAGRPGLTVVECGVGKGGGTAKLSLVARLAGARLVVFDSFRGVPANTERHTDLLGRRMTFREGAFRGRLREVQRTVTRFGAPEVVEYRKGWFTDTLPACDAPVDVALVDVDLVASTRACLVHLVPRLRAGGVLFSQDGHLRATVDLLGRDAFWRDEVGVPPPAIRGLGRTKLLEIVPAPAAGVRSARRIGGGG